MIYPNFVLGGAMKSGTTFLHNLLMNHPQISIIDRNLAYSFFDDDRIYIKGEDWYRSLFASLVSKSPNKVIGQTSADCNYNPNSVQRAIKYNPDIKFIFVLRHPIDRAYSLYCHQYGMGREYLSFQKSVLAEPGRIKKSYHNFKHYSYIERSKYKSQFESIKKVLPAENLLICDFESLIKDTKTTVNIVLNFLNVSEVNDLSELNIENIPKNPAKITDIYPVVFLSFYLQQIGLKGIGRRLINLFRKEVKPPKISDSLRSRLEVELKEDIQFFFEEKRQFEIKKEKFNNT